MWSTKPPQLCLCCLSHAQGVFLESLPGSRLDAAACARLGSHLADKRIFFGWFFSVSSGIWGIAACPGASVGLTPLLIPLMCRPGSFSFRATLCLRAQELFNPIPIPSSGVGSQQSQSSFHKALFKSALPEPGVKIPGFHSPLHTGATCPQGRTWGLKYSQESLFRNHFWLFLSSRLNLFSP